MAIELPDPGNGIPEDKTGNDEWTNMMIVRENFSNPDHAASRLVGTETGNVVEVGAFGQGRAKSIALGDKNSVRLAGTFWAANNDTMSPIGLQSSHGVTFAFNNDYAVDLGVTTNSAVLAYRSIVGGVVRPVSVVYSTANTTVDSNKNIKTSSPVLRVFKDKFEAVHEAEQLNIKFTRNGVGDYIIEGTTGLRENDWQIVIPEDEHKNQLVAFTIDEDENGTIHLKTYKRIFNFETFTFGPDLETPMDIPDGRWIDLHFNDLPQDEVIDDGSVI